MKNILITGGNRGIGKGLVEIFSKDNKVFFTSRDKQKAESVLDDIGNENIDYVIMDVASEDSVARGFQSLKEKTSSIDILINNAGILIPGLKQKVDAIDTDDASILKTFNVNTVGVLRVCKAVLPIMPKQSRIINISSGMGQMNGMSTGSIAYRLSKSALNALSIVLSQELSSRHIKVNAICPGCVQTDMGGYDATLTVKESVKSIKNFALNGNFPNGKFLRHGEILPW